MLTQLFRLPFRLWKEGTHIERNMRAAPAWIHLAVAATLIGSLVLRGQDWRTVDDFALAGDAEAHGVAVDAAGGIYVVGTADGHGIVRYSSDGGTNWITRDDFLYPLIANNVFNAITINPQGVLFVGGFSGGHWIVRRSTDQGATWATVDDYYRPMISPDQPGTNGAVYSLTSDTQGRVYGAGLMHPTGPSYNYWWVRGSEIGGANWDTRLQIFSAYGGVSQLACAGEDIYVTGSAGVDATFNGLILRSSNNGGTWTTNFLTTNEFYYALTSDSAGNVYAAGISNSVGWLVRKAAPGAANWNVIDRSSNSGTPRSIAVDARGNICVVGYYWVIRQYSTAAGQWSTTGNFSYSTNTYGLAMGTAIALDGSAFVVGFSTSNSGQRRWIVRKQSAFTPPPRLQIAVGNGSVDVSWPAVYTNSTLQWTDSPRGSQNWQTFTGAICTTNGWITATAGLTSGARFFRLKAAAGD